MRGLVFVMVVLWTGAATAQEAPRPPCGGLQAPAYAPPGPAPAVAVLTGSAADAEAWQPPPCTGWRQPGFKALAGVAGSFRFEGPPDGLLGRFGAVSQLPGVRFWSPSDQDWRPLVERAVALAGPGSDQARPDFSAAELRSGRDLYFRQGGGMTGEVTYRMRLREAGPERLVVETENVSPVRLAIITLFHPGDLQTEYFLERRAGGLWGYYSLTRTGTGASSFTDGREASLVNRAVALFRHVAGLPTDREPPVAQH